MRARAHVAIGLALGALVFSTAWYERRSARAYARCAEDKAELAALLGASVALETNLLELRAGIQLHFDDVNGAMRALRRASPLADVVRGRGPVYADAADAVERLAGEARGQEPLLETAKTDLALLRLSSRYFPIAADALSRPDQASARRLQALRADLVHSGEEPAQLAWRIGSELAALDTDLREHETRAQRVGALRADVERYEEAPTREIAQRLENEVSVLEEAGSKLDEAARPDLDSLLGHTRSILERRDRVDRIVRAIVGSPLGVEAEAAATAYEHAARQQYGMVVALRIAVAELAAAALTLLVAFVWSGQGRAFRRS
ncbi:MAG TPA: DAHL domain-containing protein [Polyangiaceae bacterium]|nr:DAHL domain-containing protein [Polyangiaceae bacterium]